MNEHAVQGESIKLMDLGDAMLETKQVAPIPYFQDTTFGIGIRS